LMRSPGKMLSMGYVKPSYLDRPTLLGVLLKIPVVNRELRFTYRGWILIFIDIEIKNQLK